MSELFEHQKQGVSFLKERKRAILADDMGLGKTRQAIVAAYEDGAKNVIVICPASLKINWQREILMVLPQANIFVVESGPEKLIPQAEWSRQWIVVNYDMLPKYLSQIKGFIAEGKIDTAIVDESHYIKGKATIRTKNTLAILDSLPRVYCLTGTPILNRPAELFNQLAAIKHPLGRARGAYMIRYCGAKTKTMVHDLKTNNRFFVMPNKAFPFRMNKDRYRVYTWTDETGATNLDELRESVKGFVLRRTKDEVLNLPGKIISIQVCEFTKEWRRAYDTAWDDYIAQITSNPEPGKDIDNILGAQQLVELVKLKQVCSQAKIEQIVEDTKNAVAQGQKVIIFSQFTRTIHSIADGLQAAKKGSRYNDATEKVQCVTLTGADSQEARQKAVDAFQEKEDVKVMVANIKAGGVGLNLTAASIVIFADMEWSPEIHAQAEDRAHRIGQTGTVNVYYYVMAESIEEDIVEILQEKKEIIQQITQGGARKKQTSMVQEFQKRLAERLGKTRVSIE